MYHRQLNILKSNSFFLFGARGSGKTTLLSQTFNPDDVLLINLLETDIFAQLQSKPSRLDEMLNQSKKKWCIIDEVQKIPELLDIVHMHIEKKKIKFALTGSSARKLKRNNANMLGGRAFLYKLFPLTHLELGEDFQLDQVLNYGSLAKVTEWTTHQDKVAFLKSYVETYLKEEIMFEQIVRNLPPFRRFIEISAANDTEIVNYSSIANDVGSDHNSIKNYYSILEETLLGFFLEPYHTSIRKRQRNSPKFYWFDTGVRRALAGTVDEKISPKSFEYGSLFESFIVNEIYRLLNYSQKSFKLSFIRIDDNLEIDLVLERAGHPTYLIEIKSTDRINEKHVKSLELYYKEIKNSIPLALSLDKISKKIGSVHCLHWTEGIKELNIDIVK